ncbi:uncharacterized protein G2W53_044461 [Senna tora]|uniref:Uncharacterized protein n=1 Tax=Senna tora TaxID=362788 RepID=A0A834SEL4_9FABA|nr:uncharacterized protein G2W53_044461 [Senna tora]
MPNCVEFHPLHLFRSSHRNLPLFFISYNLISSPQVGFHFTTQSSISSSYYSILVWIRILPLMKSAALGVGVVEIL